MNEQQVQREGGPAFWVAALIGWGVILIGIRMGLHDRELKPGLLVKWAVGGLLLHDAVWLPFVAAFGALVSFALRRRVPVSLAWAASTTAVLTLIAWPFVRGYGRRSDVPSALQRNYAHGLLVYVAITWAIALGLIAVGRIRRERTQREEAA